MYLSQVQLVVNGLGHNACFDQKLISLETGSKGRILQTIINSLPLSFYSYVDESVPRVAFLGISTLGSSLVNICSNFLLLDL